MPNAWIEHVKNWSKENNVSYGCAISLPECKEAYEKKKKRTTLANLKKPDAVKLATKIKTARPQQPVEVTGKVTKEQIDKIQKEIDSLVEKAGRVAEKKGTVTAEVSKILEKKNKLMMKRLMLVKEYKKQQRNN